jgi:hypothetical protein
MIFLSFVPLITVLISICALTAEPKNCDIVGVVQDSLDCDDMCLFGGGCCTERHRRHECCVYDDSSELFHSYAKKS